jgi:hypothetical protein
MNIDKREVGVELLMSLNETSHRIRSVLHSNLLFRDNWTDRRSRVDTILVSYSTGPAFKTRPGDRLSWLNFVVIFFNPFIQMTKLHINSSHSASTFVSCYSLFTFILVFHRGRSESTEPNDEQSGNALDSYPEGARFESQTGQQLSWLGFFSVPLDT